MSNIGLVLEKVDPIKFFKDLYHVKTTIQNEILKTALRERQEQIYKNKKSIINILHGTHMSIESRYEVRGSQKQSSYLGTPEARRLASGHNPIKRTLTGSGVTLSPNESVLMTGVAPGFSAADIEGFEPSHLLFNGLNLVLSNGNPGFDIERRTPINKFLAPGPGAESEISGIGYDTRDYSVFLSKLKVNGMNFYASGKLTSPITGQINSIPNFYYEGEDTRETPGPQFGMAVYVIIWDVPTSMKAEFYPEVYRIQNRLDQATTRSKDFTSAFTTTELFMFLRTEINNYETYVVNHIISACQVFSNLIGAIEMKTIRQMYLDMLINMFCIKLPKGAGPAEYKQAIDIQTQLMSPGILKRNDSFSISYNNVQQDGDDGAGTGPGLLHGHEDLVKDRRFGEKEMRKFGFLPSDLIKDALGNARQISESNPDFIEELKLSWKDTKYSVFPDLPDSKAISLKGGRNTRRRRQRNTRRRRQRNTRRRRQRNTRRRRQRNTRKYVTNIKKKNMRR